MASRHLWRPAPRFIKQKFQDFLFLEVSTPRFDFVFMNQDLKYYGATHEDWTGHGRRTVIHLNMGNLTKKCI